MALGFDFDAIKRTYTIDAKIDASKQPLVTAQAFEQEQNYFEAVTEYKRYLFLQPQRHQSNIQLKLVELHLLSNQYQPALLHLKQTGHGALAKEPR